MAKSGWHRRNPNSPAAKARKAKYNSAEHRAARTAIAALVAQGRAYCWRPDCGKRLVAGRWHVGHDDHQTNLIRGGECDTCNRRNAARKGNRIARARRRRTQAVTPLTW